LRSKTKKVSSVLPLGWVLVKETQVSLVN